LQNSKKICICLRFCDVAHCKMISIFFEFILISSCFIIRLRFLISWTKKSHLFMSACNSTSFRRCNIFLTCSICTIVCWLVTISIHNFFDESSLSIKISRLLMILKRFVCFNVWIHTASFRFFLQSKVTSWRKSKISNRFYSSIYLISSKSLLHWIVDLLQIVSRICL
jgi:hypothetical protein